MYDLFITSIDANNVINGYSIYDEKAKMNIDCIAHFKINDITNYYGKYKLTNGELTQLTEEELEQIDISSEPVKSTEQKLADLTQQVELMDGTLAELILSM